MPAHPNNPVLILGGGVNGAALARELLLNGLSVVVVDKFDLAFGATAKSSRLIHGGVRYLEYGDVKLVRESLAERSRLLTLAPHRVRPIQLGIPVRKRFGGFLTAAARFIGCGRRWGLRWLRFLADRKTERGLWVVRFGLWFYDRFAKDKRFPDHVVQRVGDAETAEVNPNRYRWLCGYTDGQMPFPERFVVDLLRDAKQIADERGLSFQLATYADVSIVDGHVTITSRIADRPPITLQPVAVVNATGAWGDETLKQLGVESDRLFGGTKGSHFITYQPRIKAAMRDGGIYAEAEDGRMVFVLPYREGVLVGTTDERFEHSPQQAVASETEIAYLLELVNDLFPDVELTRADIAMHYSGVRPLPYVARGKTTAISRDHHVEEHADAVIPTFTLVGGKLTTARAFAELAAGRVLERLGRNRDFDSRERPLPGGIDFPESSAATAERLDEIGRRFHLSRGSAAAIWELFGTQTEAVLTACDGDIGECIPGTAIPTGVVRRVIENEWVTTLGDLVERRLLLLDRPSLRTATLEALVHLLSKPDSRVVTAVAEYAEQLRRAYGIALAE